MRSRPSISSPTSFLLLPLSISLLVKLIAPEIMAEHRAAVPAETLPHSVIAAGIIIAIWLALLAGVGWWVWQRLSHYLT